MTHLFLDLDGVLADFDTGYKKQFGIDASRELDNVDWKLVESTENFYKNLPPMSGFEQLWEIAERHNPIILTGIPDSVAEALDNKRAWVDKHIGRHVRVIGCKSRDKSLYCEPGDVLLDDWEKYMNLWIAKGGRWITHRNIADSVSAISELRGTIKEFYYPKRAK